MLAVAKLTPGQERYYERSVASGIDDYYAGHGESRGLWVGNGARALGLEGVVQEGQLGELVRGVHPLTSVRLRRHPPVRVIQVERLDPETGETRLESKELRPVAGFDLVFSPPKSVSLLHALGSEDVRRAVNEAHVVAWQAALAYLEREACATRRGHDGVSREQGGGFVAAAYQHRTSRAQDPHLHTHMIVANMAQSPSDGRWRALDGEPLLSTYRLAAGSLYQAQLRFELSRSLGLRFREPVKGLAELEGVPECVLQEFSTRRRQVLDYLAAARRSGFYAAKVAAVETRERKEDVDLPRLREEWRARAAEHGLGEAELASLLHHRRRELHSKALRMAADRLLGPEGVTEKQTSFVEPELVVAWAQAHPDGAAGERIEALARRVASLDGVKQVAAAEPGRPARYTTNELVAIERAALAIVERGGGVGAPSVPQGLVEAVLRRSALGIDQKAVVRAVTVSGDRVVSVVGRAGAGKTTTLRAVREAFDAAAFPVIGAAPAGVAAEKLADETGIRAVTLHRLLREADVGLPRGCVLVIDEAGMADTRGLARVVAAVEQAEGKAVLVGDPAQLPAVGAGGLFAAIVRHERTAELRENRRQHDPLEQRALEELRAGAPDAYLAFAARAGRLVVADDPVAARAQLLVAWWPVARDDLPANLMLALCRQDVAELNRGARALMHEAGLLGAVRLRVGEAEFAAGDRIVCLRNSRSIGVNNGTRGTVTAVDLESRSLQIRSDRGESVTLPRRYLESGYLRHGYALTVHASQGLTVDRAFVLGIGQGKLKEWGYVAFTRARTQTRLYVTGRELERESHGFEARHGEPLSRLAETLGVPGAERLASDEWSDAERESLSQVIQRRRTAERERDEAVRRLVRAEGELDRLGLLGRARRGRDLRGEIALQKTRIERAETTIENLTEETRERLTRESRQRRLALGATRAPARDREPPGHGLEL